MHCSVPLAPTPALATLDQAGKPLNVCPECATPITPPAKPWEVLGIPKARYLATRPWKAAKMERKAFEAILAMVSSEAVDSLKREAEAEVLLDALGFTSDGAEF